VALFLALLHLKSAIYFRFTRLKFPKFAP